MTRIVNRPAEVTMGPGGEPLDFRLKGFARQRVRTVLDCWSEAGRWWEQEDEQITYRVSTEPGGIYELTWTPALKRWTLYKSYD